MADEPPHGRVWSAEENDAIVAAYFAMLADELAGRPFVKAERRRALEARIGRGKASVEWKHMNVSFAVELLGLPAVTGHKAAPNIQRSLVDAVERFLDARPEWQRLGVPREAAGAGAAAPGLSEAGAVWRGAPDALPAPGLTADAALPDLRPPEVREPALERLARKFDPVERDHRNRALGAAGEALVVDFERARLLRAGKEQLAERVRQVSLEDARAGFDVLSFEPDGAERRQEVKANTRRRRPHALLPDPHRNGRRRAPTGNLARRPRLRRREAAEAVRAGPAAGRQATPGAGGVAGGVRVRCGLRRGVVPCSAASRRPAARAGSARPRPGLRAALF